MRPGYNLYGFYLKYDDMIISAGSDRSFYIAKIISEFFPKNMDFSEFKVLDLAAGTGVVGSQLCKMGFQHLTGVGKYYNAQIIEFNYLFILEMKTSMWSIPKF